jgi:hypothetical protein
MGRYVQFVHFRADAMHLFREKVAAARRGPPKLLRQIMVNLIL